MKNEEIKSDREVLKIDEEGLKNAFNMVKEATEKILDVFTALGESIPLESKRSDSDWAREVKIRELSSGLKIADRDYYEIDEDGEKKTVFTWDEAMERFKDDPDWRLPTPKELNQIALGLGYTDEGVFDGELFAKNLGYEDEDSGSFWSSYASSTATSRYLSFDGGCLYPHFYSNKGSGFAVRCVAR